MGNPIEVEVIETGLQAKINALVKAGQSKGMFDTIGSTVANRVRLCFKLGIDPWGSPWAKIKFRAPRVKMRALKRGGQTEYVRTRDSSGNLVLTKAGSKQVQANASGKAGQPLVDTGRLRRSITTKSDGASVVVGTNVIYARTHQFGADIKPKRGKYLAFPGPNGEMIFSKGVAIPRRSFLPIRSPGARVALPPTWSVAVVRALRTYFTRAVNGS